MRYIIAAIDNMKLENVPDLESAFRLLKKMMIATAKRSTAYVKASIKYIRAEAFLDLITLLW